MKLFVYGEFGDMALENSLVAHWQGDSRVNEVVLIERPPLPRKYTSEQIVRRFRPSLSAQLKAHNTELLRILESGDAVQSALLVFKGMELFPETLRRAKKKGISLYCYNPDHPFIYSGPGSGSKFMTDSIHLYDRYFTYNREAQKMLNERDVSTAWIPFGYEEGAMAEPLVNARNEILRGCFIGNPNPSRIRFLKELEGLFPFDLYGNNWAKHFGKSPHIQIYNPVHEAAHWTAMAQYRFQLNLMALHNPNSHNMRTFSAPAAGAIMLAPQNPDHELFFRDRKEVMLFESLEDCVEKSQALLRMSFEEAMEIRKAAKRRSVVSGYAYAERAQAILEQMVQP